MSCLQPTQAYIPGSSLNPQQANTHTHKHVWGAFPPFVCLLFLFSSFLLLSFLSPSFLSFLSLSSFQSLFFPLFFPFHLPFILPIDADFFRLHLWMGGCHLPHPTSHPYPSPLNPLATAVALLVQAKIPLPLCLMKFPHPRLSQSTTWLIWNVCVWLVIFHWSGQSEKFSFNVRLTMLVAVSYIRVYRTVLHACQPAILIQLTRTYVNG